MEFLQTIRECKLLVERIVKTSTVYNERLLKDKLKYLRLHLGDKRLDYYIYKLESNQTNTNLLELAFFNQRRNNEGKLTFAEYNALFSLLLEIEILIVKVINNKDK